MLKHLSLLLALTTAAFPAWSAGGREDYDIDDNGLIEINDLADLNELRNDSTGKTLYGSNAGCPADGCRGVELTADLDFDTNQDGVIDAADTYWNNGLGWEPINFRGFFEGNGYVIRNLYVNRPDGDYAGLFGFANGATIRRTGITGKLSLVRGPLAGMVVARAENTILEAVFSTGQLEGRFYGAGGIAGYFFGHDSSNLFSTVRPRFLNWEGREPVGGIIGGLSLGYIRNTFAPIPLTNDGSVLINSHFVPSPGGPSTGGNTLAELMCPRYAGDSMCLANLYRNWGEERDTDGTPFWDFGHAYQMPGLALNGRIFRDSDGDGYLDEDDEDADGDGVNNTEDAFPFHPLASLDSDGDGYLDTIDPACDLLCRVDSGLYLDAFPNNPAAAIDIDGDGKPDRWNPDCDAECQASSGLVLDDFVEDREPPQILLAPTRVETTTDKFFSALAAAGMITYDNADLVDADGNVTYKIYYAGQIVEQPASQPTSLPLGDYTVRLVAIDRAGNASAPVGIEVGVRYEVGFGLTFVQAREGTTAKIPLAFSPANPDVPVTLEFEVEPVSPTAIMEDIAIEKRRFTRKFNSAAAGETLMLEIPVVNDHLTDEDEPDEEFRIYLIGGYQTDTGEPILVAPEPQTFTLQIPENPSTWGQSGSSSSSSSSSSASTSSSSSSSSASSSGLGPEPPVTSGGSLDWLFLMLVGGTSIAVRCRPRMS